MSKSNPRSLTVISSDRITMNMQRVVLGGAELGDFPVAQESAYVKLVFPVPGEPAYPSAEEVEAGALVHIRTYTVRQFDPDRLELTIDFALHGAGAEDGPASNWAKTAQPGQPLCMYGPGPKKLVNMAADWFLLVGDMTALPAIACNLEQMPANAKGFAVIEIYSHEDRQVFNKPAGVEIIWVVNSQPAQPNSLLVDAVLALPWPAGKPAIWAACEFTNMRRLRAYFRKDREVGRDELYISSYWKAGQTEDEHKVAKRLDSQNAG